jgi:hypothetical protein
MESNKIKNVFGRMSGKVKPTEHEKRRMLENIMNKHANATAANTVTATTGVPRLQLKGHIPAVATALILAAGIGGFGLWLNNNDTPIDDNAHTTDAPATDTPATTAPIQVHIDDTTDFPDNSGGADTPYYTIAATDTVDHTGAEITLPLDLDPPPAPSTDITDPPRGTATTTASTPPATTPSEPQTTAFDPSANVRTLEMMGASSWGTEVGMSKWHITIDGNRGVIEYRIADDNAEATALVIATKGVTFRRGQEPKSVLPDSYVTSSGVSATGEVFISYATAEPFPAGTLIFTQQFNFSGDINRIRFEYVG